MTRPPDIVEIGAVALTAAYDVVLNRHLPEATHLPANLAASGALLLLAHHAGVGRDDLGLAADVAGAGARTGLAIAAGVAGAVVVGAAFPATRRFFVDEAVRDRSTAELTYHALLRIPIATALGEELVFRSALLGLFGRGRVAVDRGRGELRALRPLAHPPHRRVDARDATDATASGWRAPAGRAGGDRRGRRRGHRGCGRGVRGNAAAVPQRARRLPSSTPL